MNDTCPFVRFGYIRRGSTCEILEQYDRIVGHMGCLRQWCLAAVGKYNCPYHGKLMTGVTGALLPCERFGLIPFDTEGSKDQGPTQADCVVHGLGLAFMTGMFKKNK